MADGTPTERSQSSGRGQQRLARERGLARPHRRAVGADAAPDGVRLDRVVVVLVETREAGNIGQAARAMLNMGLTRLTLVRPQAAPRGAEARRRAMHAWEVIKHAAVVDDLSTALAATVYSVAFTTGHLRREARPVPFASVLDDVARSSAAGDVALVFGNEVDGLSNADLRRCAARAQLATSPALPSLNLAQAVLLAASGVFGHRRAADARPAPPATSAELDRLWHRLWDVLDRTRAVPLQNPARLFGRLQQTLRRQGLSAAEVKLWLGVLGDVAKALDHPAKIKPTAAPAPFAPAADDADVATRAAVDAALDAVGASDDALEAAAGELSTPP